MPDDLITAMVAVVALILQLDYRSAARSASRPSRSDKCSRTSARTEPRACVRLNVEDPDPYHKVRRGNLSMAPAGSSHCPRDTAS